MRRRVSILTVLTTMALMVPAVPALAANLIVDDNNGDCAFGVGTYATIQAAINDANGGDVILVCPGTYQERLVINKSLTITGSGVGATFVQPTDSPATNLGHGHAADVHLTTGASGTTIENISFDFNGPTNDRGGWGILLSDLGGPAVTGVTIQNNDIQLGVGARTAGGAQGLGITTGKDADISGLLITGNSFHGVAFDLATLVLPEAIYLNPNSGIGMMTVSNNTFGGNLFVGVSIESDNVLVTGNTVVNAAITASTHGIRVNDFVGDATDWKTITISDNEISGFDNGLRLGPPSTLGSTISINVEANSITGNTTGIRVRPDVDVTAPLNSIVDNTTPVVIDGGTINAPNSWWGGAAGPTDIGDTTWLTTLGMAASPASLTVGGSTTVTATLRNNDGDSVGAAPLEVDFSRTGANALVSHVDEFSPAQHTYSGANAGTDTVTGTFVVAGVDTALTGTTSVQWNAAPSGGGGGDTGGEATMANPLVVTVTGPTAASAVVTEASEATVFVAGYSMLGVEFNLEADPATAANPLVIVVRIDGSVLPAGVQAADIAVFRDAVLVADCDVPSGTSAVPDPCVAERTMSGDDVVITIRTSTASVWSFGLATPPGDISYACPLGSVPDPGFTDVGAIGHEAAIDCLAWYGITVGTSATTYGPFQAVTRAQMASFLTRMLSDAGVALPANAPDAFGDDGDSPHHTAINQLAALGLTLGTTATTYSPQDSVTRAQMAKFLVETYEFVSAASLPRTGNAFTDDNGSPFEPFIDAAAAGGITVGTGPGVYDPTAPVLRSQMASFITRVANRLLVEGFIALP